MNRRTIPTVLALALMAGCAARTNTKVATVGTLAELRNVRPDVQEVKVEQGLDQAMQQYRRFLEEAPENRDDSGSDAASRGPATRKAVRDTHGRHQAAGNGRSGARPGTRGAQGDTPNPTCRRRLAGIRSGFRAAHDRGRRDPGGDLDAGRGRAAADPSGPLEAIALYDRLLTEYPNYEHRRQGPLSEGAGVRRARPHRRSHRDDGASDPRESEFRALRRSAVQAGRVLLHAQKLSRRRDRLFGDHQPGAAS